MPPTGLWASLVSLKKKSGRDVVVHVNGEGHGCAYSSDVGTDEFGGAAPDHDRRRIGRAGNSGRHDRSVRHTNNADAMHTQFAVDDGIGVAPHSGCAGIGWPKPPVPIRTNLDEVVFALDLWTWNDFSFADSVKGLLDSPVRAGSFGASPGRLEIAVRTQEIRLDDGWIAPVGAGQAHPSAARRLNQRWGNREAVLRQGRRQGELPVPEMRSEAARGRAPCRCRGHRRPSTCSPRPRPHCCPRRVVGISL